MLTTVQYKPELKSSSFEVGQKYSPTSFRIVAHTWQLNANHYVHFLAWFLGLVVPIIITSLQAHVCSDSSLAFSALVPSKPLSDPAIYPTESE